MNYFTNKLIIDGTCYVILMISLICYNNLGLAIDIRNWINLPNCMDQNSQFGMRIRIVNFVSFVRLFCLMTADGIPFLEIEFCRNKY